MSPQQLALAQQPATWEATSIPVLRESRRKGSRKPRLKYDLREAIVLLYLEWAALAGELVHF